MLKKLILSINLIIYALGETVIGWKYGAKRNNIQKKN